MAHLEWIFWGSLAFVAFTTLGYPLMLLFLVSFKKNERHFSENEPLISLIISAYNEEKVIGPKLENSLSLTYPREKLEIIVASDGSDDRTNQIVETFKDKGVILYKYKRLGKTGIQNETVKKAKGDIVVFSDANAIYKPDALKMLIRNFGNDQVACVCGQLIYKSFKDSNFSPGEKWYWMYEKILKEYESRLSSLVGVNGSIYAVWKNEYIQIDDKLISDFVGPLEIVKSGKKVVYEHEAISEEPLAVSYREEFVRKVRILTRSIHGLLYMKALLNPFRYGIFSIQFLIHKLFRYLIPAFLIIATLSLVFLTHHIAYFIIYCLIAAFLILAVIGKFAENITGATKIFNLFYYYFLVNYAVIFAWINVLKGEKITTWTTDRN